MNSRVSPALAKALLLEAKYKKPAPLIESPDADLIEEKAQWSTIREKQNSSDKYSETGVLSRISTSSSSHSKPYSSEFESSSARSSNPPSAQSLIAKIYTVDELILALNSVNHSNEEHSTGTTMQSSHNDSVSYTPSVLTETQQHKTLPEMQTDVNLSGTQTTSLKKEKTLKREITRKFSACANDKQTQTSTHTQVMKSSRDRSTSPLMFSTENTHPKKYNMQKTQRETKHYHRKVEPFNDANITLQHCCKNVREDCKRHETVHCCCCKCKSVTPFPSSNISVVQIPYFPIQPEHRDNWFASCMVQQLQLLRLQLETQHQTYQMLCEWSQTDQIHAFNT